MGSGFVHEDFGFGYAGSMGGVEIVVIHRVVLVWYLALDWVLLNRFRSWWAWVKNIININHLFKVLLHSYCLTGYKSIYFVILRLRKVIIANYVLNYIAYKAYVLTSTIADYSVRQKTVHIGAKNAR